jgi:hypothetical protein
MVEVTAALVKLARISHTGFLSREKEG